MLLAAIHRLLRLISTASVAGLLLGHSLCATALAETPIEASSPIVQDLIRRMNEQEQALLYLREQDAKRQASEDSFVDLYRTSDFRLNTDVQSVVEEVSYSQPGCDSGQKAACDGISCACNCGCYPCKCPQTPAPCIECPRISTRSPYFNLRVFGSLNGEMLYSEARPLLSSGIVFLFPVLGQDTRTFEAHAKSTNLGAALVGPEILGLQFGGSFVTYLYGEQFEADRYGFYVVRAFGDLKNEKMRFAIGLEGDVINPLSPTTLNFNAGNGAGNLGFFRGQFRFERYFHCSDTTQLTTQFALSNPVATSFANFDRPPLNLLEDNGCPNLEGRVALGLGQTDAVAGRQAVEVPSSKFRLTVDWSIALSTIRRPIWSFKAFPSARTRNAIATSEIPLTSAMTPSTRTLNNPNVAATEPQADRLLEFDRYCVNFPVKFKGSPVGVVTRDG